MCIRGWEMLVFRKMFAYVLNEWPQIEFNSFLLIFTLIFKETKLVCPYVIIYKVKIVLEIYCFFKQRSVFRSGCGNRWEKSCRGKGWQFWKNREIKEKRRERYERKESQQPLVTYAINFFGNGSWILTSGLLVS